MKTAEKDRGLFIPLLLHTIADMNCTVRYSSQNNLLRPGFLL